MDVADYIREYLYKQDFLDIPGLGTFFLTREPFSIEGQKQSIRPGSKTLIFRENAVINNDLLSYFIARRQSISVEEARQNVREFVGKIRELFLTRGSIEIPQLGKFAAPDGFHLQFTATNLNFSPSSFGLGNVSLSSFAPIQETDSTTHYKHAETIEPQPPVQTPYAYQPAETVEPQHPTQTAYGYKPVETQESQHPIETPYGYKPAETQESQHAIETPYGYKPAETQESQHAIETPYGYKPAEIIEPQPPAQTPYGYNPAETQESQHAIETPYGFKPAETSEVVENTNVIPSSYDSNLEPIVTHSEPEKGKSELPSAEDLYKMYGFKKDSTSLSDSTITAENKSIEPELPTPEINQHHFSDLNQTDSLHPAHSINDSSESFKETPISEKSQWPSLNEAATSTAQPAVHDPLGVQSGSDLLYNPLAWPSNNEPPIHSGAVDEANTTPAVSKPFQHLEETETVSSNSAFEQHGYGSSHEDINPNDDLFPKPEPEKQNNRIYWILGSLLLISMIAVFVYLQKDTIQRQWRNQEGFDKLHEDSKLVKKDSVPIKTSDNTAIENASKKNSPATVMGLSLDANGKIPDTATVKTIDEAGNFLLVAQSKIHLKQTAQKRNKELTGKQINSEIVVIKDPLFPYLIVVGEFQDQISAGSAKDSLKKSGVATMIIKNKTKKDDSQL